MDTPTPPSVCDALGNAGPLPVVNWNGKAYKVAAPTPAVLAAVERQAAAVATENVKALKGVLPPAEWQDLWDGLLSDLKARKWAYGRELFNAVSTGPDGDVLLLWGCLSLTHPELTVADVRRMQIDQPEDTASAVAQVIPRFLEIAGRTLPLPAGAREAMAMAFTAATTPPNTPPTPSPTSTPPSGDTPA